MLDSDETNTKREKQQILESIASAAMMNFWKKLPSMYQMKAVALLLPMHCAENKPSSVILVQGTGSGKLAVPQTVGVFTYGVTLVVEKSLSLGAEIQSLSSILTTLPNDRKSFIFILPSLQKLLNPI